MPKLLLQLARLREYTWFPSRRVVSTIGSSKVESCNLQQVNGGLTGIFLLMKEKIILGIVMSIIFGITVGVTPMF
jgi:hypothetical protein